MHLPTTMQVFSELFLNKLFPWCAVVYLPLFITFVSMIDEKKLKTVRNYAKKKGFHRNWIYQLIHKGAVKLVEIDGVKFIDETKT